MHKYIWALILVLAAKAQALEIGPINGKLTNHTSYKNSLFKISLQLTCRSYSFIGPKPSCGDTSYDAQVQEDGTYQIPRLSVDSGYENELRVIVGIPYEQRGFLARYMRGWSFFDRSIRRVAGKLDKFTVFESLPQEVFYETGIARDEFLAGAGRDLINSFQVSFVEAAQLEEGVSSSGYWNQLAGDNGTADTPGQLPGTLLFEAGSLPDNAAAIVNGRLNVADPTSKTPVALEYRFAYASTWPKEARTFQLNPAIVPVYDRSLDGSYGRLMLQFNSMENGRYENSILDGSLTLSCDGGVARGTLTLESRGGASLQFKGSVEVSGTCQGEKGELQFTMPYRTDRGAELLTLAVDRMVRGSWEVRSPSDSWDFMVRQGQLTTKLPIRNATGQLVGNVNLQSR